MNAGRLSRRQLQGWVANRFYYQENIPRKDAAILANCPDVEVRRRWIRRIVDHDGTPAGRGRHRGVAAPRRGRRADPRGDAADHRHLVPGVRFAVDAYVTFARTRPWVEAVASSLTELFAPDLMAERLAAFERWYPWIDPRRPRLLPRPPRAGSPRLRARPGGRHRALPVRRGAGARRRRAVVQVRRAVEPDGRHRPGLPGVTAMDPTHDTDRRRRCPARTAPVGAPRPADFCRTRQRHILLLPETVVVLNGSGADILELCDGRRTVAEIVAELRRAVPDRPRRRGAAVPDPARRPALRGAQPMDSPFGLLAELTYRCPLACAYCSNPLNMADYADELATDEWRRVLVEAARPGRAAVPPVRRRAAAAARPRRDRGGRPTTSASTPTS